MHKTPRMAQQRKTYFRGCKTHEAFIDWSMIHDFGTINLLTTHFEILKNLPNIV